MVAQCLDKIPARQSPPRCHPVESRAGRVSLFPQRFERFDPSDNVVSDQSTERPEDVAG
jgi:hypothetical protein